MRRIEHLEAPTHERTCSVRSGSITYTEPDGESVEAEFYVRTCGDTEDIAHTDPQTRGDRQDDFNEQYVDEVSSLMERGCTEIKFKSIEPSPFF